MWLYTDAWAAGFFDGEGCLTVNMKPGNVPGSLCAQTTQKLRLPLDRLKDRWGGTIDLQTKGCHRWRLSARQAEPFLAAIYPFSIVKRRQIEIAFAYLATMGRVGVKTSNPHLALRLALIAELSDEKRNWGL